MRGHSQKKIDSAKKIIILDVSKKQDAAIRKVLLDSFTKTELDKMASKDGVTVVVDSRIPGAGAYDSENKTVYLRPDFATAGGTITHEFTHHLRLKDTARKGEVTRSRIVPEITEADRDLEEAATTAETITRLTPYHEVKNVSYYGKMVDNEEGARRMIDDDRMTFVGNAEMGKVGLKGKRAINALEKQFDGSEIAKLSYYCRVQSAKDTLIQKRKEKK